MGEMLIFDWMNENEVVAHVEANLKTGEVKCEEYSDLVIFRFLDKRPHTLASINEKFSLRCPDKGMADLKWILANYGLSEYNPIDIVRWTHGVTDRDKLWVRFEGEPVTWDDVKELKPYYGYVLPDDYSWLKIQQKRFKDAGLI